MKEKIIKRFMSVPQKKESRILYLDFLKALAAFLVVFYHYSYYKLEYGFVQGVKYLPNLNRIVMSFASCSVPIFFLVNGVLMFKRKRDWKTVYCRVLKMLVLTIIWEKMGFPAWFFKTLIIIYLIFPCVQYLLENNKKLYYGVIIILFLMPFCFNAFILFLNLFAIENVGFIAVKELKVTGLFTMYGLLYFMLGAVLEKCEKYPTWVGILCSISGWSFVVLECVIYTNLNDMMYDGVNAAFPTIGALLLTLGMYMLSKNISFSPINKFLQVISNGIFPIYLMHMFIIKIFRNIVDSSSMSLLSAIFGTCLVCIVCTLIGGLIRRIPVVCWFIRM